MIQATDTFETTIQITPVSKGRPRFFSRGKFVTTYTPQKTREFEQEIKRRVANQFKGRRPFEFPLSVSLVFGMERPISVNRPLPSVKPDIDNLIKAVLDPLNGIVFKDDALIVFIKAGKQYSKTPFVYIKVERFEPDVPRLEF